MIFHNTTAYSYIASQSDGGAIYIYVEAYGRNINKITESQFINNTARQENGGAIALYETTNSYNNNSSVLTKCQFSNNMCNKQNWKECKTIDQSKFLCQQYSWYIWWSYLCQWRKQFHSYVQYYLHQQHSNNRRWRGHTLQWTIC